MSSPRTLYSRLGGRPTLERVHGLLYDELFGHAWLGRFFEGLERTYLEEQQTDFLGAAMGGPKCYAGQYPRPAHRHMLISDELFDLRHELLERCIARAGVPAELASEWLRLDEGYRSAVVKHSIDECEQRYVFEDLVVIEDPRTGSDRLAG